MPFRPNSAHALYPIARSYNLTAASANEVACGVQMDATSATAVAGPGSVAITLTILDGDLGLITPGYDSLEVDTGAGKWEVAPVTALNVAAKTVTCTFAFAHSGTYPVRLVRGSFLSGVSFHAAGTAMTLTLWNGNPQRSGAKKIGTWSAPPSNAFDGIACEAHLGLFAVYAGTTGGDVSVLGYPAPS